MLPSVVMTTHVGFSKYMSEVEMRRPNMMIFRVDVMIHRHVAYEEEN